MIIEPTEVEIQAAVNFVKNITSKFYLNKRILGILTAAYEREKASREREETARSVCNDRAEKAEAALKELENRNKLLNKAFDEKLCLDFTHGWAEGYCRDCDKKPPSLEYIIARWEQMEVERRRLTMELMEAQVEIRKLKKDYE